MLAYIVAALIWWFIELNRQNTEMTKMRVHQTEMSGQPERAFIEKEKKRKIAQYVGEGITFFLLIIISAIIIFRAIRRQLRLTQQQQHFMMAITHEIKTPIAVATLNLETIKKRSLEDEQKEKLMNNTLEELNRLNALSNNLLISSQMEAGGYRMVKEQIDLNSLIENWVSGFRKRYYYHAIHYNNIGFTPVEGDPLLLEMLVNNIVDNAVKYAPRKTDITLTLQQAGGLVEMHIADQGNGIPEADRQEIFTKFYRRGNEATRSAKGTGLGLYLVKKVAELHGGGISVRENEPVGSVFTLTLPAINS